MVRNGKEIYRKRHTLFFYFFCRLLWPRPPLPVRFHRQTVQYLLLREKKDHRRYSVRGGFSPQANDRVTEWRLGFYSASGPRPLSPLQFSLQINWPNSNQSAVDIAKKIKHIESLAREGGPHSSENVFARGTICLHCGTRDYWCDVLNAQLTDQSASALLCLLYYVFLRSIFI